MVENKSGGMLHEVLMHIIIIGLIFGLFFIAIGGMVDSRGVKQQVLEKQTALLVDSADVGMTIIIYKSNKNGMINSLRVDDNRIFIKVAGLESTKGYSYFSRYNLDLSSDEDSYKIKVEKNG